MYCMYDVKVLCVVEGMEGMEKLCYQSKGISDMETDSN